MHATIRRYAATDQASTAEFVKKAEHTLVPRLSELPGFKSYSMIETGNGAIDSVSLFDTEAQAEESTRVTANWVRDEKLETTPQDKPKVTTGRVLCHKTRELVTA